MNPSCLDFCSSSTKGSDTYSEYFSKCFIIFFYLTNQDKSKKMSDYKKGQLWENVQEKID